MDNEEAKALLAAELTKYREQSFKSLQRLLSEVDAYEIAGSSGAKYQIEIQAFWDDKPNGNLRISAGIDDGGWRAFLPLGDGFIMSPDGTFLNE